MAVRRPRRSLPRRTPYSYAGLKPVPKYNCLRVKASLTGRFVSRAASAAMMTCGRAPQPAAEAADTFRRLGAAPLLARTRAEQELSGQQVRRDSAPDRDAATVLTAQESRVVRLAAEGLTNREIGAQLLISPRTVGYHLANVFPKLGIVSRADLARVDFGDGLRLMD